MSALTILIVVIAAVPFTLELQLDSNLNDVLTLLNQERLAETKNKFKNDQPEQDVNYKKILKAILKKAAKVIQHEVKNRNNYINRIHLGDDNQNFKIHNDDREANNEEILNQYLSFKPPWLKSQPIKRKPNQQLDKERGENRLNEVSRNNDLTGYSKIYLVLNPEANLEKADVRDISNLVSSMFSKTNTNHKSVKKDQPKRLYKGFVVRDIRRRIRDSNEVFSKKESMEHDHKKKRGRNEYPTSRGRTGVPYVHHRGDVYEREK